jgi:hypothetical protein
MARPEKFELPVAREMSLLILIGLRSEDFEGPAIVLSPALAELIYMESEPTC